MQLIPKNFSKTTFFISTNIFVLLLIMSFLAAYAEDEGTLGTKIVWVLFAKFFYIIRFPTHTLLWPLIIKDNTAISYIIGLLFNCVLYGLLLERLIAYIKMLKLTKETHNTG